VAFGVKITLCAEHHPDDVFVHYTGGSCADELVKAYSFVMPSRPDYGHEPDLAIIEREMRSSFRSPALMMASMIFLWSSFCIG